MPRSFSISIQSDLACWPDFLPLTVPAFWRAWPNSRTFSVIVVLPASGCEIIAKVRRLATSWERLDINNGNLIGLVEKRAIIRVSVGSGEPIHHDTGIFSPSGARIVIGPAANLLKSLADIQRSRPFVALPDFKNHLYHAVPDGFRHGVTQQVTTSTPPPQSRMHTDIQQVSFIDHIVHYGIPS